MTQWSVEVRFDTDATDEQADRIVTELAEWWAAVSHAPLAVRVTAEGLVPSVITTTIRGVSGAVLTAGVHGEIVAVDACTVAEMERQLWD